MPTGFMTSDMRKFLVRFLLFLLPLGTGAAYLEFRLHHIPNSYNTKRHFLEQKLGDTEILVLGSSHALRGINPEHFQFNVFNASNISQSLHYDVQLTLRYIDQMPRLKFVIVTISYFSLWYEMYDSPERWRDFFYAHFWDVRSKHASWLDSGTHSCFALYGSDTVLEYWKKGFSVNLAEGLKENGWMGFVEQPENSADISDRNGRERIALHNSVMKDVHFPDNRKRLAELVVALQNRNIIPVFVTTPVYKTYAKYADRRRVAQYAEAVRDLARKDRAIVMDFFSDDSFGPEDFRNSDHLNARGAEKLSRRINEMLQVEAGRFHHRQ